MFKKLTWLAAAVAAVASFGAATASASWYHSGVALFAGEERTIHFTGTWKFSSSAGGIHCANTTVLIHATGGTTTGHATFSVSNPTECEVSGGLVLLCGGTTKLETVTHTQGATVHIIPGTDHLTVTNFTQHQACANGFKFDFTSGEKPLTIENLDNPKAISKGTISGSLKTNLSSGTLSILAHLEVTPSEAGTYGITG